jgi:hypothetical protein
MTLHEMNLHEAEAILKAAFANIEERPAFSEEEKMAFTCADDALCQAAREARRKINAKPGEAIAFLYRNIWFMSEPLEDDSDVIWIHPYGPDFNETIDDNGLPLQVTYWNA